MIQMIHQLTFVQPLGLDSTGGRHRSEYLQSAGVQVEQEFMHIPARVLEPPALRAGGSGGNNAVVSSISHNYIHSYKSVAATRWGLEYDPAHRLSSCDDNPCFCDPYCENR